MRKGLGTGRGQGYKNLIPVKDSVVHSRSARGYKNQQRIGYLSSAKPLNTIIRDLDNFMTFSKSKTFQDYLKSNNRVMKYKNTFIKKLWRKGEQEAKIQNILADEFIYYPRAIIKSFEGNDYLITHEVSGDYLYKPISELKPFQKLELAKVTKYLYKKGYIDFDLRKANLIIDKKQRPIIIDFDNVRKIGDEKNLEMQYNLNILSIFGFRDKKANQFLTMTQKQLGLR
jgi:RIO-like serine/threonine protein kinase